MLTEAVQKALQTLCVLCDSENEGTSYGAANRILRFYLSGSDIMLDYKGGLWDMPATDDDLVGSSTADCPCRNDLDTCIDELMYAPPAPMPAGVIDPNFLDRIYVYMQN